MINSVVSKRYAIALFELAEEKKLLSHLEIEARNLKGILADTAEMKEIFSSPKFSNAKKNEIVDDIFTDFSVEIKNTIKLMVERHHFAEIVGTLSFFIEMANASNNTFDAVVTSAKPLTATEEKEISTALAKKVGVKSLNIQNVVDASLIGGLKVRIGNQVFDSSLSTKLRDLGRHITV